MGSVGKLINERTTYFIDFFVLCISVFLIDCLLGFVQMTRDSMKNYHKGVGKPPFCEITAKATTEAFPPNLKSTVNFYNIPIEIERTADDPNGQSIFCV